MLVVQGWFPQIGRSLRAAAPGILVALLLVAAFPVHAGDRKGWSLSGSLGASKIKDTDGADSFDGSAFGFAVDVEYRFTPHFALGLGGFSLGQADDVFGDVETQIDVSGFDFFGRAILPLSEKNELFFRVGGANYFVDIDPGGVSFTDALFGRSALELGVGADLGRQENLAFRVEGRYFQGDDDESGALFMIGVNYLF